MSDLFELAQPKGKWHKFPSFNLGVGAKLYKNFAQKLLAVSLCMAVVLLGTPMTTFADEPTTFITAADPNHWGRSDLRAYLNGVEKEENTLPLDTTHGVRQASGYYESQFSDAEFALVKPFKYNTNVFVERSHTGPVTSYETTDRFWLPSGNSSSGRVLGWGADDLRLPSASVSLPVPRPVPVSYWPAGSVPLWTPPLVSLRASGGPVGVLRLVASRASGAVSLAFSALPYDAAAAFKLDLSSVIFASAASAASLAAVGGAAQIEILGTSHDGDNDGEGDFAAFGESSTKDRPSYGMYLKADVPRDADGNAQYAFTPAALDLGTEQINGEDTPVLKVTYSGGAEDQYVVVQAFKEDNLEDGTTSYEAAAPLSAGQTSATLAVSSWGLSSLDGYTIKVWMEDASGGSSLAAATAPVTFVGSGDSISKTETDAVTNQRVFAMKKDLQTSWGDLQALKASNETAYNNVIAGKGQDGSAGGSTNSIHGLNPTNQKIYFGTAADGSPLEFWIAGRETYDGDPDVLVGDGEVDPTGEIMTLYQAKSVETKPFNASYSNYDGNKKSVTLQLADEQTAEYTGSAVAYPTDKVTAKVIDSSSGSPVETDIPFDDLGWQHRAQGATFWTDGMPTAVGTYQLRCYAPGVTDSYERTYSSIVTFNVKHAPQASNFVFSPPADLTYDGNPKSATVTGVDGVGTITVKYYKENGTTPAVDDANDAQTAPTDVGTYAVKIDVAEGDIYAAADGLGGDWTFTINKKSLAGAKITIDPSTMVYTGKKIKPKITSVTVDGISVPSDAYRMKVSEKKQAGQTVTVALTAKSNSNFKGSSKTTFTITKAAPGTSDLKPTPSLAATYGQTLGDIKAGLASAIGSLLGVDSTALKGVWAWEAGDETKVGDVGENKFTAIFTPTDGNYAKTTIDVTVKVSVDTSKWGDAQKRDADGKTQYVESSGKTSIELTKNNLSDGGILWLFEESYGKSAWYGIDLSTGAFDLDKGLRFYVQWLSPGDDGYDEVYAQLDDAQKARVEGNNGWIFLIGVEGPDGKKVPPAHPVNVYVQLGDPNEGADWDLEHLKAYYITSGGDENVPVEDVTNFTYPGGTDEFGMMTLSHFSPYFIFDELTDEEKAALELKPEDGNNHPTDKPNSSGTDLPGTGDISTELLISGLAIVLVSSLGVMLRLITNKKKFEE